MQPAVQLTDSQDFFMTINSSHVPVQHFDLLPHLTLLNDLIATKLFCVSSGERGEPRDEACGRATLGLMCGGQQLLWRGSAQVLRPGDVPLPLWQSAHGPRQSLHYQRHYREIPSYAGQAREWREGK